MKQRIGIGYDIHKLVAGRPLILGGVQIPYSQGLEGHSDADVLLHAVCDALLGALSKGDIGEHFPNNDPQYKNISSLILLEKTALLVKTQGYTVGNVDCVIQIEEPHLKAHKTAMKANIAKALNIPVTDVNIKATTMEKVGSIGRKEGIAATAVVIIEKI